jgi:hypothetical protein
MKKRGGQTIRVMSAVIVRQQRARYMPTSSSRGREASIPSELAAGASEKIKGSISLYNAQVVGFRGSRPSNGIPADSV